ncbi:MAG: toxin-antitoxin system YwqK family antitoxin [Bacteroidales bacterium]|jgi:antitoxin component YwqK of YwqJK toxin-antitoxin module|nr:toxin-antitoxin system YwqK family antitoxin [Bacteroidales bacterium]
MMWKRLLVGWLFGLLAVAVYGQAKNQRDAAGRKQGYWEAVDSKGGLVYSGYFKDDKPVGEMKRYYPTGKVRVIMNYDNNSTKARAMFFWQNGEPAAEGNYVGTRRDSVWLYYSYYTKAVSHRAEYMAGKHHGKEQSFYPNGKVAEETIWENDLKNGPWKQFFENGQLKSTCTYVNDKLDGLFTTYFLDGTKEIEGLYRNDTPDGEWKRYDEKGKPVSTVKYANGTITNMDELEAAEQAFFKKVMEQEGRIKEPTLEDMMREAQQIR